MHAPQSQADRLDLSLGATLQVRVWRCADIASAPKSVAPCCENCFVKVFALLKCLLELTLTHDATRPEGHKASSI